jgi:hypothetical protein
MRSRRTVVSTFVAGALLVSVTARADSPTLEAIPHLKEGEHFTIDPVVDGLRPSTDGTGAVTLSGRF